MLSAKKREKKAFPGAGKWHTRTGRISLIPTFLQALQRGGEICHLKYCFFFFFSNIIWDIFSSLNSSQNQSIIIPSASLKGLFWWIWQTQIDYSWANTFIQPFPYLINVLSVPRLPDFAAWPLTLSTPRQCMSSITAPYSHWPFQMAIK